MLTEDQKKEFSRSFIANIGKNHDLYYGDDGSFDFQLLERVYEAYMCTVWSWDIKEIGPKGSAHDPEIHDTE